MLNIWTHKKRTKEQATLLTPKRIQEMNRKFNAPFGKPVADGAENAIYSKNCQISMDTNRALARNDAIVIGGPGSGKTFNIVLPNLLQMYGSYVVADPSGRLMAMTGKMFEENGYDIRVLNLEDMACSNHYNPLRYIRDEKDVTELVECLMENTDAGEKEHDPYTKEAEAALMEAAILYLKRFRPEGDQNLYMVARMLGYAEPDKQGSSRLDKLFDEARAVDPGDTSVKRYDAFRWASAGPVRAAVAESAAARMKPFLADAVKNLTSSDDIALETAGDQPTILYLVIPPAFGRYTFLVSVLYSQMISTLKEHAIETQENGKLKYGVRFIMDEFANTGIIHDFNTKLAIMGPYRMSVMILAQTMAQVKVLYPDGYLSLAGYCFISVYLGGSSISSREDLPSGFLDPYRKEEKAPFTIDELRHMGDGCCAIFVKGQYPFLDEKYRTADHPNAKYLGDPDSGDRVYTFPHITQRGTVSGQAD